MRIRVVAVAAILAIALSGAPGAQPVATPHAQTPPRPYLADVQSWVMTSEPGHRAYQISVALPDGYDAKAAPYPP